MILPSLARRDLRLNGLFEADLLSSHLLWINLHVFYCLNQRTVCCLLRDQASVGSQSVRSLYEKISAY